MIWPQRILTQPPKDRPFVAIDFETADYHGDSACAVGLVRVEGWQIVAKAAALIRPPRPVIRFTHIHGITWEQVKDAPPFAEVWAQQNAMLADAAALVAHNAGFDRGVLASCCLAGGLDVPELPFACTVRLARKTWAQPRNDLKSVCTRLGIALNHHDALSDAEACARIVIAALRPVQPRLF